MEINRERFKAECYRCKLKIDDIRMMRFQKLTFHVKCFTCQKCNCTLDVNMVYLEEANDRIYCEICYHDMLDRCTKCEEEIIGQIIQIEGNRRYHKECFICAKCKRTLCEYGEIDGKLYCSIDYHQMTGPKCFKCQQVIMPDKTHTIQTFKFKDNTFHSKCFVCDKCSCSLDDPETGKKIYFTIMEQKLCRPCALAAKKAISASKQMKTQEKN